MEHQESYKTLKSMMSAKQSQQRVWQCHEERLFVLIHFKDEMLSRVELFQFRLEANFKASDTAFFILAFFLRMS